ncbi:hypothetical protein LWI28_014048 [Acer negundo]|uniref:Uncharacterized protein n=1 Tax=Acer negundo TaxID=4023 RepID=A0AAD5P5A4_ACENE|nr:hypothetical protein LWI28_014048 [Acer negundo]
MAAENEYREEDQNVKDNVNVSEVDNQLEYVNIEENVAEVDNLAVVRYVPQNDEHIQQTENVVQNEHALDNEDLDQYLLTGLPDILPTQMEVKEDYWKGIDDDMSEGPQFVPLKDFIGKEDRVEPSSK